MGECRSCSSLRVTKGVQALRDTCDRPELPNAWIVIGPGAVRRFPCDGPGAGMSIATSRSWNLEKGPQMGAAEPQDASAAPKQLLPGVIATRHCVECNLAWTLLPCPEV